MAHLPEPVPMMPHYVPAIDTAHKGQEGLPTESEPK